MSRMAVGVVERPDDTGAVRVRHVTDERRLLHVLRPCPPYPAARRGPTFICQEVAR